MNANGEVKKTPKWFKWAFGLSMGFFVVVLGIVVLATNALPKAEITSMEQWKKHREYIKSFSGDVILNATADAIYAKANDYGGDGFYKRCDLDACGEYKNFIRTARSAAQDGVLTPKELVEIAESKTLLDRTIKEKNEYFKTKFATEKSF